MFLKTHGSGNLEHMITLHFLVALLRLGLVPVARLGHLAVDKNYQGQKLGAALLWDAFERASRAELMAFALIVDA